MEIIDFKKAKVNPLRMYGGANGNKIGVNFKDENYMLKFPPKANHNPILSYANSCISEYVACNIVATLGVEVQETLLGMYDEKIVVACKDFEENGFTLKDFAYLKNTSIDSDKNGYGTELSDILYTIEGQEICPVDELKKYFWRMFIVDAFLGNFDRHNGNWGFLINNTTGTAKIAPIFDCGSCLYPQIDEEQMQEVVNNQDEIEQRIYVYPTSAIRQEDKKINYYQFLMETKDEDCIEALNYIGEKINITRINEIIDNTPFISNTHKTFLKVFVEARKEHIIDKALEYHNIIKFAEQEQTENFDFGM